MDEQLGTEASPSLPYVSISREPWEAVWPALESLATEHFSEVEPESPRVFRVDTQRMAEASRLGWLRIHTARVDGELWGYISWNCMWDLESQGLPIATQGAWFMKPKAPWGLSVKLFTESVDSLRSIGVQCIFPHHRMLGRGRRIGRFFESIGATKTQDTYMLWIGAQNA